MIHIRLKRIFKFMVYKHIKAISLVVGFCIIAVLFLNSHMCGGQTATSPEIFKDPEAIQRVLSGEETTANAVWWGFNKDDSTGAIQGAINSGAGKVIIPYVGNEWIVRPIKLAGNQEIIFEPGVVVIAKSGEFKDRFDCLFSARNLSNVTLRGYGATLRMRKNDYKSSKYEKSEHRHVLEIMSSSDVNVFGLKLESSGGDGIFITRDKKFVPCKNILIRDCTCDDNYRQGISVISVDKLRIENCVLKNTAGTSPRAGIDLEPDDAADMLVDVVLSNCISENNGGAGFMLNIGDLSEKSREVSVLFVNCYVKNCISAGIRFRSTKRYTDNDPKGLIEFKNCTIEDTSYAGAHILWDKTNSSMMKVKFTDCKWRNVAKGVKISPIYLELKKKKVANQAGGVEFVNCFVYDEKNRPFMKITDAVAGEGVYDVKGEINVSNPHGVRIDSQTSGKKLPIKINSFTIP